MELRWREDRQQKAWLWIGVLFAVFYFTEAALLWGPQPRVQAPPLTPLIFWGLFGAAVVWIVNRPTSGAPRPTRLENLQSRLLGATITASVVGVAFLVIHRSHDITLGHAVLLFVFAQAALIIGALTFNPGWLAAGVVWIAGGVAVLCHPPSQDCLLGAVMAAGFVLIGLLRKRLVVPERDG